MEKKNYITSKGFKKLNDELDHLNKVERPQTTKIINWAASNGDRSENADYIYGKKRLREIDKRIRFLNTRINTAKVVEPQNQLSDKILFGATVEIKNENDELKIVTIVGVDEIDTSIGHISWQSPLGKNLLHKTIGDIITVKGATSETEWEIINFKYNTL